MVVLVLIYDFDDFGVVGLCGLNSVTPLVVQQVGVLEPVIGGNQYVHHIWWF